MANKPTITDRVVRAGKAYIIKFILRDEDKVNILLMRENTDISKMESKSVINGYNQIEYTISPGLFNSDKISLPCKFSIQTLDGIILKETPEFYIIK